MEAFEDLPGATGNGCSLAVSLLPTRLERLRWFGTFSLSSFVPNGRSLSVTVSLDPLDPLLLRCCLVQKDTITKFEEL